MQNYIKTGKRYKKVQTALLDPKLGYHRRIYCRGALAFFTWCKLILQIPLIIHL